MERFVGPLRADVLEGEGAKYTGPMLLLHGLWDTPAVWQRFMGYLAHRGWHCFALHLQSGSIPVDSLQVHLENVRASIESLDAAPVILGHDLGAYLALRMAGSARAVVAVSPLVLPPLVSCSPLHLDAAAGFVARYLLRTARPARRWSHLFAAGVRESTELLRELVLGQPPPEPSSVPCMVMRGELDPILLVDAAQALAARTGADLVLCPSASHRIPAEPGWESRVGEIHRWIVQRLGAPLLALYEETDGSGRDSGSDPL
jgi:pimeloyl-ACP methyl ester carboxylesterase